MRILQIHPFMKSEALSPAAGGMARASLLLTRMLAERGHEVQVLPIPEGLGSRELWEVAPGKSVEVAAAMHVPSARDWLWLPGPLLRLRPLPAGIKNIFYDALSLAALRRELSAFRPDVLHNHLARRPFPRLARALRLRGNLLLTHHHGEPGEELGAYDRIVFPSRAARDAIAAQSGVPVNRTGFIYNPVAPAFRQPLERSAPRKGIVFVGAVRVRKGIDLLLDAYRLEKELRKEPLTICGEGEDLEMAEQARREGLPVTSSWRLPPEETAKRVRSAKLVVIPSRLEGFSIALAEALCCGTPVVGWAPQVLEMEALLGVPVGAPFDGRTQTAAELAAAIRGVLEGSLMAAGKRRALARAAGRAFDEERYLEAYLAEYRELIGA